MRTRISWKLKIGVILLAAAFIYLALLIPEFNHPSYQPADHRPFAWSQDSYWSFLEARFNTARHLPAAKLATIIDTEFGKIEKMLDSIETTRLNPDSPKLASLEKAFFEIGPEVAACPSKLAEFVTLFGRLRNDVKYQSRHWDMNNQEARDRIYRLIYGGRAAVEEVMLQHSVDSSFALNLSNDEPSQTPAADLIGVKIHSGDILVSRGGAATSALIARGSDYPGNFSHAALAYVDDKSGTLSIIEAHIERGVTISTPGQYLRDTKLRIMVLRPRSDLPAIVADPMLPHKAAALAYENARKGHIPYDFEMDSRDHRKLFCSEVAFAPYESLGVNLWTCLSSISNSGIASWLAEFGVRYFQTREPSDLEYDPQVQVIAEWRDPATLYKDHTDNAVIDVMLENADQGMLLKYDWYMLPIARLTKAYCIFINALGAVGPIPEGMSASAALRNKWFTRIHDRRKRQTLLLADEFKKANGYVPPYWELVKLARKTR
jgi:hypothetical protein